MNATYRRSDFDVTDSVQVSSPAAVLAAVRELYRETWRGAPEAPLETAFEDFERLFTGQMPGYLGVDTVYHDMQHTLDVVLAMSRLLAGHDRSQPPASQLGAERALVGLVTALFHDAGYIRETSESNVPNGAEFTRTHVSRGARMLARYLPTIGLGEWSPIATRIIHFTGYEVPFAQIRVTDARDRQLGFLLGTADLLAQMADRCYLEKCRDRLYAEFVLGGVAVQPTPGSPHIVYGSGLELLRRTPQFVAGMVEDRLEQAFEHSYRFIEPLFGGRNPYLESIQRNVDFLEQLLRTGQWPLLRRNPPVFTMDPDPMPAVRTLMLERLKSVWDDSDPSPAQRA